MFRLLAVTESSPAYVDEGIRNYLYIIRYYRHLSDKYESGVRRGLQGTNMASESERVTVRVPSVQVSALHALVESGQFATISDAVRAAINNFIDEKFAPDYIRKMTIELPKGNVVNLEELVKSGDSVSVEDAVRNAVREYIRRRLSEVVERKRA